MTHLKNAPSGNFFSFAVDTWSRIKQSEALLPDYAPRGVEQSLRADEYREHFPFFRRRSDDLFRLFVLGEEAALRRQNWSASDIVKAQRYVEDNARRNILLMNYEFDGRPHIKSTEYRLDRETRVYVAVAIHFAVGKSSKAATAAICNRGLTISRIRAAGTSDDEIRNALNTFTTRRVVDHPLRSDLIKLMIHQAEALWLVWEELGEGDNNRSGVKRRQRSDIWRRDGHLYLRYHHHLFSRPLRRNVSRQEGELLSIACAKCQRRLVLLERPKPRERLAG